ncbi:MAG: DinB family protein [Candidatus Kariarchaeaceae archaeon]|jgi:uncharacterized damage-inducible protein DinB
MDLENFANYHVWGSSKLRELVNKLSDEEFSRDLGKPFGNVREICEHIIGALKFCFFLSNGDKKPEEFYSEFDLMNKMTKVELIEMWTDLDLQLKSVIIEDQEGDVRVPHVSDNPFLINKTDFYLQYLTHSIYHRGQVIWALKKLGKKTLTTDYLFYHAEMDS